MRNPVTQETDYDRGNPTDPLGCGPMLQEWCDGSTCKGDSQHRNEMKEFDGRPPNKLRKGQRQRKRSHEAEPRRRFGGSVGAKSLSPEDINDPERSKQCREQPQRRVR